MKKFLLFIGALLLSLTLIGCDSVEDKTYSYDSFDFEYAEGLTTFEKLAVDAAITIVKATWENTTVTFNADGTTSLGGHWVQDGSEVQVFNVWGEHTVFEQDGKQLTYKVTTDNYSYTVILTVVE